MEEFSLWREPITWADAAKTAIGIVLAGLWMASMWMGAMWLSGVPQ